MIGGRAARRLEPVNAMLEAWLRGQPVPEAVS